jgi:hypothetical protein
MDALAASHDAAVQMIDTSLVRVQCRRFATRYDKLAANYLALAKLASIRIWLRANESASWLVGRYVRPAGRQQLISLTGKSEFSVHPLLQKYLFSFLTQISFTTSAILSHTKGAFRDRHERWARDAVDADSTADERC